MFSSKSSKFYECKLCDYITSRNSQYQRHLLTDKHEKNQKSTFCQQKSTKINQKVPFFVCDCGRNYKERSGLWRHKKVCEHNTTNNVIIEKNDNDNNNMDVIKEHAESITDKDELILFLIKECSDYKNMIVEQQSMMMKVFENGVGNNSHNTNYSNNKTFNLQVFLNETCKDAMNINEFVDSIKLQLSDLEKFAEVGYVEGITNIITTNLKALDITQRPVHCTDKKREIMYIKDEDKWEKEDEHKSKLRRAIKRVSDKNIKLLPQFREKYPEYSNSSSKISDKYDKMVIEVMTSNDEKENKVIHNISSVITIDKFNKKLMSL